MAATLDDLLDELKRMADVLEEIRDNGAGPTGGAAASGGAASKGAAGKDSGKGPPSLGSSIAKGGKQLSGALNMGSNLMEATGSTEIFRNFALGASTEEARAAGGRALQRTATQLPFSGIFSANTQQTLQAQDRAQGSVSSVAEAVARAGGSVSDASIDAALGRQNEIEANVQKTRQKVAQRQGVVGKEDLDNANTADLAAMDGWLKQLVPQFRQLSLALGSALGAH